MNDVLRLPKKTLFALDAVVDVAYNARPDPVQSKDITDRQGIPPRYLEQAMQQLVRAGILKGVRGPRGGYTLARERRRITVADVVRVIAADEESDEDTGSDIGAKVIRPLWTEIQDEIISRLETVTLEDLCRRAQEAGVDRAQRLARDFTI
ncbi:MAG: Rrf2 family transcriptional regulator [Pseudomonadota bacterium]|nr:Rrf2 family transcriptional regulator [Pseudomonadota bacterium]